MSIIYSHLNPITNLRYIGYTTKTLQERFSIHCKKTKGNSKLKFHNAIRKYGTEIWISEIIEEVCEDKLCEREIYWISYYDSYKNGYNLTSGGDGRGFVKGRKQTKEHKEAIRKSIKEKWLTEIHPSTGKSLSENIKEKIRKTLSGKKHTEERRKNQSIAGKNKKKESCVYCGKVVDICNINQWHNEKCKFKNKEILFCESSP